MAVFGVICDGYLNSNNEECCYPYHLTTNCLYDVRRTSSNNLNNYCTSHTLQSEYMIPVSPVDKLIDVNRNKMKLKNRQKSFKKKGTKQHEKPKTVKNLKLYDIDVEKGNLLRNDKVVPTKVPTNDKTPIILTFRRHNEKITQHEKPMTIKNSKIDDSNVDKGNLLRNYYVVPNKVSSVKEKSIIVTPRRHRRINWEEHFPERRRSRRLNNLNPHDVVIKCEDGEVSTSYDTRSYRILNDNLKIKQEKYETINDTHTNNQGDVNQTLIPDDTLLNIEQNNFNMPFEQNQQQDKQFKIEPIDESQNKTILDENNILFDEETQQSQNKTIKPNNDMIFDEDPNGSDLPFGQRPMFSSPHRPNEENNDLLNKETEQSQNKIIVPERDIFDEDSVDSDVSFSEQKSFSYAYLKEIFGDFNDFNVLLNGEIELSESQTAKLISKVIYHKDSTDINMPFSQDGLNKEDTQQSQNTTVKPINNVILDENNILFDEETQQSQNTTVKPINNVILDENNILFDEETQQSQNKTVKPINDMIFDEDSNGRDLPFSQHPMFSSPHTPNEENNDLLNKETEQSQNKIIVPNCDVFYEDSGDSFFYDDGGNNVLLNGDIELSQNQNNKLIHKVLFGDNLTDINISFGQHGLSNAHVKIALGNKNDILLNTETQQSQNTIIKPIDYIILDENSTDSDVPFSQHGPLSSAHLKITSDDENISLNKETRQRFESIEDVSLDQNLSVNNSFSSIEMCEPLNEVGKHIECIDLTKDEDDETYKKPSSIKSFPRLRVMSPSKLYKSFEHHQMFANLLAPNYNYNVAQTSVPLDENISNPNVTDSDQVITNNNILGPIIEDYWTMGINESHEDAMKKRQKRRRKKLTPEINSEIPTSNQTCLNVTDSDNILTKRQPKEINKETNTENILPTLSSKSYITNQNILSTNIAYSDMSLAEKKLYKEKFIFITALGLVAVDKIKATCNDEKNNTEVLPKTSKEYTDEHTYCQTRSVTGQSRPSYSKDGKELAKKLKIVPVLVAENRKDWSCHQGSACSSECDSCHTPFNGHETPQHIAQIRDPDIQQACLKSATYLVGLDSCLCSLCFRHVEKLGCNGYFPDETCIVRSCTGSIDRVFQSPWLMDQIKHFCHKEGVISKLWPTTQKYVPICENHLNQIKDFSLCQLCGNQTTHKFKVTQEEARSFQSILNTDEIGYELNCKLFLCKPCRVFLVWRMGANKSLSMHPLNSEVNYQLVLKRICAHQKIDYPPRLRKHTIKKPSTNTDVSKKSVILPAAVNDSLSKPKEKPSDKLCTTVIKNNTMKPSFQKPTFVPVFKTVHDSGLLTTIKTLTFTEKNTHKVVPYQHPNKSNDMPLAKSPTTKTLSEHNPSKYKTHISSDTMSHNLVVAKNPSNDAFPRENILPLPSTASDSLKLKSQNDVKRSQTDVVSNSSDNQIAKKIRTENYLVEKKNVVQEGTPQLFIPVSTCNKYIIIPKCSLSKCFLLKPVQLQINKNNFNSNNSIPIIISRVPPTLKTVCANSAASVETVMHSTMMNPQAVTSNIAATSRIPANSIINPRRYIKILPAESIKKI